MDSDEEKKMKITILCIVFWVEIYRKKWLQHRLSLLFNVIKLRALLILTIIQFRYLTNLDGFDHHRVTFR